MVTHQTFRLLSGLIFAAAQSLPAQAAGAACDVTLSNKAWSKCAACHSLTPNEAGKAGPNLYGVVGRRAGSLESFVFSPAISKSDIVWTVELLDAFLANPQKVVPNNRMPFSGLPNAKERAALVCTLNQGTK
jgi:cytochrome c